LVGGDGPPDWGRLMGYQRRIFTILILAGEAVVSSRGTTMAQNTQPSVNCSNSVQGDNSAPLSNNCGNTYLGPPRIPTGLYQNGERIGLVQGITPSEDNKTVTFRNLRISGSGMNLRAPIEIQNALISCPTLFNANTNAAQVSIMIAGDTVCDIVGQR
jgi:hypothetical protein